MGERQVLAIFDEMAEWCLKRGLTAPVNIDVDAHWHIAVTGKEKGRLGPDEWKIDMEPYTWAVWFNGFLAGVGNPFQGEIAAGEAANETTLSAALKEIACCGPWE